MTFSIYNLHNFQFIFKKVMKIIKEPHSEIIPKLFVQRSKILGLFEAKDKKLTFATFKKNYELNKRTILKDPSFLVESFKLLKFKELKDKKIQKMINLWYIIWVLQVHIFHIFISI